MNRVPRMAFFPGLFLFVVEGLVWAVVATTGWEGAIAVGALAGSLGVIAAVVAVPIILVGDAQSRVAWSIVSVCVSFLGGFFAFIFYLEALTAGCGGNCFA
jgi:hypothetical protein